MSGPIRYQLPSRWIQYNPVAIVAPLTAAKAAIQSLTTMPYQRSWADELQTMQLKREIAGTSRIEGADLDDGELEEVMEESAEDLFTRSQKQAAAARRAYRWISAQQGDVPLSADLILHIHRLVITGADDDHCSPGTLRKADENVTFGSPRHRGAEGGEPCATAFHALVSAAETEFRNHDPLIQALAAHWHIASMHPFVDGNGRSARAVEAFLLQRVGLRDTLFIAMSNYYYEEKAGYLRALADVRASGGDLTPFLSFALRGIELQCRRLSDEIRRNLQRALFRNVMYELYTRLRSGRKRVIMERQLRILNCLLEEDMLAGELRRRTQSDYAKLRHPDKAFMRDLAALFSLDAISFEKLDSGAFRLSVRLEWATEITETEFFKRINDLPKAKAQDFITY